MLKKDIRRISNFLSGGLAKKFVLWIFLIILLLDALTIIFVQMNMKQILSDDLLDRGDLISKKLAEDTAETLLISNQNELLPLIENMRKSEKNVKYVYIVDTKGTVLTSTFDNGVPEDVLAAGADSRGGTRHIKFADTDVLDFKAPIIDGKKGYVHVGMDMIYINEHVMKINRIILAHATVIGLLGILMAYIAGNYLTRPVRDLVKGTEEIGKGNLGYQINAGSIDEIKTLSNAFNQMSVTLGRSISELRASEEKYRNLV
ncbi:MAG TPA: HAMP domain-containing protein, partial [Candidatus Methanoperedens sp.]